MRCCAGWHAQSSQCPPVKAISSSMSSSSKSEGISYSYDSTCCSRNRSRVGQLGWVAAGSGGRRRRRRHGAAGPAAASPAAIGSALAVQPLSALPPAAAHVVAPRLLQRRLLVAVFRFVDVIGACGLIWLLAPALGRPGARLGAAAPPARLGHARGAAAAALEQCSVQPQCSAQCMQALSARRGSLHWS